MPVQVPAKRSFGFDVSFGFAASAGLLASDFSTLFRFDFVVCSSAAGAGVGFSSSTIGAGERCAIIKIDNVMIDSRIARLTAVKVAPYSISHRRCIRKRRFFRLPRNAA